MPGVHDTWVATTFDTDPDTYTSDTGVIDAASAPDQCAPAPTAAPSSPTAPRASTDPSAADQSNRVLPATATDIFFELDRTELTAGARSALDAYAAAHLAARISTAITVAGYASTEGAAPHNDQLANGRAKAVADYLASMGIPADEIRASGAGPTSQFSATDPRANRRAVIDPPPASAEEGPPAECEPEPAPAPSESKKTTPAVSAKLTFPLEKSVNGPEAVTKLRYVTFKVNVVIKFKGTLELESGEQGSSEFGVTPGGYSDGFVQRFADEWSAKEGVKLFGINTGASDAKVDSQFKIKDGVEASISGTLKFESGEEAKLKFNLVKMDAKKDWQVSAGQLESSFVFKSYPFGPVSAGKSILKGTVQAVAVIKVEPNYAAIAAQVGEKATEAGIDGGMVAELLSFDGFVAASFLAISVATVIGGVHGLVKGAETMKLHDKADEVQAALVSGYIAGMTGETANPTGSAGQAGFDMGQKAYAQLHQIARAQSPSVTDEQIRDQIRSEVLPRCQEDIWDRLKPIAQQAVWEAWASQQTGLLDSKETLKWGWTNIYGSLPSDSDPLYAKYYH